MGISVLMSLYEKEHPEYLKLALDSILTQTRPCDELILMKDGPLPQTLETVITEWGKKAQEKFPVYIYQFPHRVQLGRALAKGVLLCHQDYIARMDTDDIAVSNRFELQENYMLRHPEISVVGGGIEEFLPDGNYRKKLMPQKQSDILVYGKYRNPVNHVTVMFRKEAVLKAGNYCHFPLLEDYDLWNRMLAQGAKFHNLPQVLVHVRTGTEVYRRRGGYSYFLSHKKLRKQQYQLKLLNRAEYFSALVVSFIFAMQPTWLRAKLYQNYLRQKE